MNELLPSRIVSWQYWRHRYTIDFYEPFDNLRLLFDLKPGQLLTSRDIADRSGGVCPICKDNRAVRLSDDVLIYCLCEMLDWQNRVVRRYEESPYRTPIGEAKLTTMEMPMEYGGEGKRTLGNAITAAAEFIHDPTKSWLVIQGIPGTGKTHILKAINYALRPLSIYIAARDFEAQTHESRKDDEMGTFYEQMKHAPILLIDDLGAEYGGRLFASMIDRVIDARYEDWPSPVVVTSNLGRPEIKQYLPRSGDRLFDNSKSVHVWIKSPVSYRQLAVKI